MDAIHLPNAITLPTAFGAPGTPLPAGQMVQALVLELIQSDVFRLQLPQAVVDVRTDVPLTPGSTIAVVPKGTGQSARLTLYSDDPRRAAPPSPGHAAPSLAGKQPIGEATIIRAAPAAQASAGSKSAEATAVRDAPSIGPARQPQAPPQPTAVPPSITPQQALGAAVRVAASRQTGLAPLLADVEQVVQMPASAVPAPVRAAAEQVLALRVPLAANLPAPDLKLAFARSGVLFEPRLAAEGRAPVQSPHVVPEEAQAPPADLKAALIVFRQVLKAWAAETAPARPVSSPPFSPARPSAPAEAEPIRTPPAETINVRQLASALAGEAEMPATAPLSPEQATSLAKTVAAVLTGREAPEHAAPSNPNAPPPPYRGAPLAAQQPVATAIAPDTPPHETAERLLGATEGALARTTLLQAASLPEQLGVQRSDPATQRWTFEVPFATPQGTGTAQFEISRDGRAARDEKRAPVWRARFSLDLEPMGPVHALVALAGERASVTLWAERPATATRLNEQSTMLGEALRAAELEPADFQFRVGTPPSVARQAAPGRFMDRAT